MSCEQVEEILAKTPGVQSYTTVPGMSILDNSVSTTNGMAFVKLTNWKEREADSLKVEGIIATLQRQFAQDSREGSAWPLTPRRFRSRENRGT